MVNNARYVHTNMKSEDWEKLARLYEEAFGCVRVLPERDVSGTRIENGNIVEIQSWKKYPGLSGIHGARNRALRGPGRSQT